MTETPKRNECLFQESRIKKKNHKVGSFREKGAAVTSCVSDGYSTIKSAMKAFGITGKEDTKILFTHSWDNEMEVFFVVLPHLTKFVCNQSQLKNLTVQVRKCLTHEIKIILLYCVIFFILLSVYWSYH